jgi:recombinational DNA repair protein (RecF pathway)
MQKTVLFYGGRGGGKMQKGSVLELGHMISYLPIPSTNSRAGNLERVKEWQCTWFHREIRKNYRCFSQLCFYLECLSKLAPVQENNQGHEETYQGLFATLSNAVVQLDRISINPPNSILSYQLAFFLAKILINLGLCPPLDLCVLSSSPLMNNSRVTLYNDQGGFGISSDNDDDTHRLHFIADVSKTNYSAIKETEGIGPSVAKKLFEFLCYQYNLNRIDFRTNEIFQQFPN